MGKPVPVDDLPTGLVPAEDLPAAPPSAGFGDVKAAEHARGADWEGTGNVPVGMMTGDPDTDRRIAQNLASLGHRRNLTPSDALHAGAVTGGAALSFLPGVGPAILSGGLLGGGLSQKETPSGVALDAAGSAAASGLLAKLLPWAAGRVGKYARGKVTAAEEKAAETAAKIKGGEVDTLRGQYGGLRQTENKAIREAAAMEAAGTLTPENAALLAKARESGRFNEALNEALANDLEFLTTRAPEVSAAKQAYQGAAEALPEAIAAEKARQLSPEMMKEQLGARLKRYGPMGIAGAIAGHALGGTGGALLGGAAGAAVRPMLRASVRAYQHPAVQNAIWSPVANALEGESAAMSPVATAAGSRTGPATLEELIDFLRQKGIGVRMPAPVPAEEESR